MGGGGARGGGWLGGGGGVPATSPASGLSINIRMVACTVHTEAHNFLATE